MAKYTDLIKGIDGNTGGFDFNAKYKKPIVEPVIVGLSGIDPDEKTIESELDHEKLSGLLGGSLTGHYHITSEQLAQLRAVKKEFETLTNLLNALSSELGSRISSLEAQQESFEDEIQTFENDVNSSITNYEEDLATTLANFMEAKENLNTRMDAIVGGTTEDTEILDARVDANSKTHPNLGHNIRSIHQALLDYIEFESSFRECRDDDLQKQLNELSVAIIIEINRVCNALLVFQTSLYSTVDDFRDREHTLYTLLDEISETMIAEMYQRYETNLQITSDIKSLARKIEELTPTDTTDP